MCWSEYGFLGLLTLFKLWLSCSFNMYSNLFDFLKVNLSVHMIIKEFSVLVLVNRVLQSPTWMARVAFLYPGGVWTFHNFESGHIVILF
ncbi:hypothetical protein P9112_009034 [Eukaryota sp. TZLM1-RC]